MAKLTIPHVRGREKAIFDKLGITLIESMEPEEFEAMMIDFLSNHNVLHLATCKNNVPRCTPLEYFNVGLDVHVFSEGGGKIVNIKNNPLVSFGISDPFDPLEDFFASTGLQVWGTASIFRKNDAPEKFQELRSHTVYGKHPEKIREQGISGVDSDINFHIITIRPTRMRYFNLRKGSMNITWKRDE
jgi:hypothetical protein